MGTAIDMIGQIRGTRVLIELHSYSSARKHIVIEDIDTKGIFKTKIVLAKAKIQEAISVLTDVAKNAIAQQPGPSEVEIEAAFNISAESNVVFVKGGGNATFRVKLKWQNDSTAK